MTLWLWRCPQGHASVEPRQDGTYRCGSCDEKYREGPFDARETEFPVAVDPIATPDAVDVLAALDEATQRRPSAAARQLSTPLKATTQQLLTLRGRGLVEAVDVTGRSARWRLTTAGEQAVDGSVDPNAGCELATDGGEDNPMTETDDAVDGRGDETFERTVTVRGEEKKAELGIKTCDNCGGDMEVPADKLGNGRTSLCSIACVEDYDGY